MFPFLFLLLSLALPTDNPVAASLESFSRVVSYAVTLHSRDADSSQVIRYFYKKPGFVRMEFVKPHKGAVLVYDPGERKARLRPLGFVKPLVLTLSPDSSLITSPGGHRVDSSDLGAFLSTVKELADQGRWRITGREGVNGRDTYVVEVTGNDGVKVSGDVHRYILWLDRSSLLPLRTRSFNAEGNMVEEVQMDDLDTAVDLPDSLFIL